MIAQHPWERQVNETDRSFAAFSIYLHLGPRRGLKEAARIFGCSTRNLGHWSKKYDWVRRCAMWEAHHQKVQSDLFEQQARAQAMEWAREAHMHRLEKLALGKALVDKVRQMLEFPLAKKVVTEADGKTTIHLHPARWDFSSAARMAIAADSLIAQACGGDESGGKTEPGAAGGVKTDIEMSSDDVVRALKAVADRLATSAENPVR